MTRPTMIQAARIARQLAEGYRKAIGWIGEGSSAKAYVGTLDSIHLDRAGRGLRLAVRNERTGRLVAVVWRLSQALTDAVMRLAGVIK